MPFALIPFLLLVIPIVEIAAFIGIGGQIGIWLTLLMILVTAIIGTILLRVQGFQLIRQIQSELNGGKIPGRALGHGFLMLIAGLLLLTPGFITDALGFVLFVPAIRDLIWNTAKSRIHVVVPGTAREFTGDQIWPEDTHKDDHSYDGETVIDLSEDDYSTDSKPDDGSSSPWNAKPDSTKS